MITTSMKAQQALENDCLLTENDLESRIEKIPHRLLDSNVSITRIKKYVTDGAWRLLIQLKKKLEKGIGSAEHVMKSMKVKQLVVMCA
eukprot:Seg4430.3 transcript_id=Seg4430.3/GoldUCD/mRNA.D3Y31 product="hypothetical protein" pseudo=true protein_id=Seg4430.3/GoldUCD/D3Y31